MRGPYVPDSCPICGERPYPGGFPCAGCGLVGDPKLSWLWLVPSPARRFAQRPASVPFVVLVLVLLAGVMVLLSVTA